jgi:hypothetical protein
MKKTAVQWLIKQIEKTTYLYEDDKQAMKVALEMEKQQIIDAYETAIETDVYNEPLKTGEQYYNQTFKN